MKPIFEEDNIQKLKELIGLETELTDSRAIFDTVDTVENGLKAYNDNSENKILLFGTGILLFLLSSYLLWVRKDIWPLLFLVSWVGAFLYYRVSENSLSMDTLVHRSKISQETPVPKIEYLQSGITLKMGRKNMLKVYLSVFLSAVVMMIHTIAVSDASFYLNLGLLIGAIVLSFFFWKSFYKDDLQTLAEVKSNLEVLKTKYLLESHKSSNLQYQGPLFQEEEE